MIEGFRVYYRGLKTGEFRQQDFQTMLQAIGFALPLVIANEYEVTSIVALYTNLGQG